MYTSMGSFVLLLKQPGSSIFNTFPDGIISRPPNAVKSREKMGECVVVCEESRHVFEGGDKNVVIIKGILVNSV